MLSNTIPALPLSITFLFDKTTPFDLPVVPEVYNKIDLVSKFCLDCLFFNSV